MPQMPQMQKPYRSCPQLGIDLLAPLGSDLLVLLRLGQSDWTSWAKPYYSVALHSLHKNCVNVWEYDLWSEILYH